MNKININFLLDKRSIHKNGTYSVTLAIYSNGDSRRFTFNNKVLLTEEDWIKMNSPRLKNKSLIEIKNYIEQERVRALGIIDQLGDDFSFDGFRSLFRGTKMAIEKSYSVYELFNRHIVSIRENGQIGTAGSYDSAMKSLKIFSPKLSFKEVTPDFLRKYECWMIENGNSMNTVGIYLRSLRVIMNIAKNKELITEKMYPFGSRYNGKYEIPTGSNIKKALEKEEVKKIKNAKCINPEEDFARDMWMFSFYCNGMDMADIFY